MVVDELSVFNIYFIGVSVSYYKINALWPTSLVYLKI